MERAKGTRAFKAFSRFALISLLVTGSAALAQPPSPGSGKGMVAFEVQSVDPQSWVVTAQDLESGEMLRFRLSPDAFRGQRFRADLAGARSGAKISIQGTPGVRLDQAVVERPQEESLSESPLSGARTFDREGQRPPAASRGPAQRPGAMRGGALPGRQGAGPIDYEVISVDARNWQVEARGSDGETVSLEIDPKAFAGYRFSASAKNLRAGEGFELLAANETPLADCCVVKSSLRR